MDAGGIQYSEARGSLQALENMNEFISTAGRALCSSVRFPPPIPGIETGKPIAA
jgi:hypothetical protein